LLGFAIEATLNTCDWFDNSSLNLTPYGLADLNGPNVFANYVAILKVWTGAEPCTALFLLNNIIHHISRLGSYTVESLI
jgi:hypothetical protein